jgi:K+-sensing histidine kinase KdpD
MENIPANLNSLITFAIVILVAMLLLALKNRFAKQIDELQQQVNSQEIQLLELQDLLASSQSQLDINQKLCSESQIENEQVSKHLEHRIKVTQDQFNTQFQTIEQLLHQQPEDKLYTRAQKLVELGADIAEIMRVCDIPRAEAEMLLSVHRQKISK